MQNDPVVNCSTNAAKPQGGQYPAWLERGVTPADILTPREQRETFLRAILGDQLPDGLLASVWSFTGGNRYWAHQLSDLRPVIERDNLRDVYLGVGLVDTIPDKGKRTNNKIVVASFGFGVDADYLDPAHTQDKPLPPDEAAALAVLRESERPFSLLVHSGHGLQAWWLWKESWFFGANDDPRHAGAVKAHGGFQAYMSALAAQHGWYMDNVGDPSRILRMPGTLNAKFSSAQHPDATVPVRLLEYHPEHRYTPDDLLPYCEEHISRGTGAKRTHSAPKPDGYDDSGVQSDDRFTQEKPCPICGGWEILDRGTGTRCWGYYSRDHRVAYCTRPECAGNQLGFVNSIGAIMYRHAVRGPCKCHRTHAVKFTNAAEQSRSVVSRRLADIEPRRLTWVMEGYIPFGELTLSAAPGGAGKTHLNCELLARIAGGLPMPGGRRSNLTEPAVVAIVTSENTPESVLKPQLAATARELFFGYPDRDQRVEACLGNIHVVEGVEVELADGATITEALKFPQDHEPMRQFIKANAIKVIAFDPLISFTSDDVKVIDTLSVRHLLDPLALLARDEEIAILAVVHFSKRTEGDFISRVSGSRQFTDTARSVFTVVVQRNRDDGGETVRWMASAKLNIAKTPPALAFTIVSVEHPYFDDEETSVVRFTGDMRSGDAEQLDFDLRNDQDAKPHSRAGAVVGLMERLNKLWHSGERTVSAKTLKEWQEEIDVSDETWKHAKREVGLNTRAAGKGQPWFADLTELPMFDWMKWDTSTADSDPPAPPNTAHAQPA